MSGNGSDRIERGLSFLQTMTRIREFEQHARIAYDSGEIPGILHLSIGQEAIPTGVCAHLKREDYVASTHRGHGHCIAKGADLDGMMAELYGKITGTCKGKGGSMHIADFSVGMLGANGVVGGGIGIAVGAAQAAQLLGKPSMSACFFGDGAVNRGPFLEGLNWAALFNVPVLFVCEDNRFSAFTHGGTTTAGPGPVARAESLGVRSLAVDGNDVFAVYDGARTLIEHIRTGNGPAFLHAVTYRLDGHTVFDKSPYRSNDEVEKNRERDPIVLLETQLREWNVDTARISEVHASAIADVERSMQLAREAAFPERSDAYEDVQLIGAPT